MYDWEKVGQSLAGAGLCAAWEALVFCMQRFQVLPHIPRISFPLSASGSVAACTGVGSVNFSRVIAWRMRESRLRLSKVASAGVVVAVSPPSGATTSGTSSLFSLRFMAMIVVCMWYVAVYSCPQLQSAELELSSQPRLKKFCRGR